MTSLTDVDRVMLSCKALLLKNGGSNNLDAAQINVVRQMMDLISMQQDTLTSYRRQLNASKELLKHYQSGQSSAFSPPVTPSHASEYVTEFHCHIFSFDDLIRDWSPLQARLLGGGVQADASDPSTLKVIDAAVMSASSSYVVTFEDTLLKVLNADSRAEVLSIVFNSSFQFTMLQPNFASLLFQQDGTGDSEENVVGFKFSNSSLAASFQNTFRRFTRPLLESKVHNNIGSPVPVSPPSAPPKPSKFSSGKKGRRNVTRFDDDVEEESTDSGVPIPLLGIDSIPYSIDRPEFTHQLQKHMETLEISKKYSSTILAYMTEYHNAQLHVNEVGNKVAAALDDTELSKALEALMTDAGSSDSTKLVIPEDPYGAIMHDFAELFREIGRAQEMLLHVFQHAFISPLSEVITNDFASMTALSKALVLAEKTYESSLGNNIGAKTTVPPEKLQELETDIAIKKTAYELCRFDLVNHVNKLTSSLQMQTIESSCSLVYAFIGFFNNCYDITKNMIQPMQRLHSILAQMKSKMQLSEYSMVDIRRGIELQSNKESIPCSGPIPGSRLEERIGTIALQGYLFKLSSGMRKEWQRRWFVIAEGKLFYLRSPKDLDPELVCDIMISNFKEVRPTGKTPPIDRRWVIELNTPGRSTQYMLQAEGPESLRIWLNALRSTVENLLMASNLESEGNKTSLGGRRTNSLSNGDFREPTKLELILKNNPVCADCHNGNPNWAVLNLGMLICLECSGVHRSLGVHISKVRSLTLDSWEDSYIQLFEHIGNSRANSIFEANVPASREKPGTGGDDAGVEEREAFIKSKYEFHAFVEDVNMSVSDATDALCAAAKSGSIIDTLKALAHGADINMKSKAEGDTTALHIAAGAGHILVVELLILNGCRFDVLDSRSITPLEAAMLSNQIGAVEVLSRRLDELGKRR